MSFAGVERGVSVLLPNGRRFYFLRHFPLSLSVSLSPSLSLSLIEKMFNDEGIWEVEEAPAPPSFTNVTDSDVEDLSDNDFEKLQGTVSSNKSAAAEAETPEEKVELLTKAMEAEAKLGELSAMTIAKRAEQLFHSKRVVAALGDASAALAINPDSSKSLRVKGMSLRRLGKYEEAMVFLGAAQSIDFNDEADMMMTEIRPFMEDIKKAKAERSRAQQEPAKKNDSGHDHDHGHSPSGGANVPAGAFPGMESLSPQAQAKFLRAISGMSNGQLDMPLIMELMSDPELGPYFSNAMGGMAGGMGGAPPTSNDDESDEDDDDGDDDDDDDDDDEELPDLMD